MDNSAWTKSAKLAHKYQRDWLALVAMSQDAEAVSLGNVVDALFANDPRRAIRIVRASDLSRNLISEIKFAFDLHLDS